MVSKNLSLYHASLILNVYNWSGFLFDANYCNIDARNYCNLDALMPKCNIDCQVLLRGSRLRNTAWICGLVVYTGQSLYDTLSLSLVSHYSIYFHFHWWAPLFDFQPFRKLNQYWSLSTLQCTVQSLLMINYLQPLFNDNQYSWQCIAMMASQ